MTFPRSFCFLRHGETDWNREERMQGWTDIPLNATGRAQAAETAALIENFPLHLIVTSPLLRARETAEIVAARLNVPLVEDTRLKERGYGVFEGRLRCEHVEWRAACGKDPQAVLEETGFPCPEKGETYADLKARTVAVITEHLVKAEGKDILFVSHGGVYRVLRRLLIEGVPDSSPNARPYLFEKGADGWAQREIG